MFYKTRLRAFNIMRGTVFNLGLSGIAVPYLSNHVDYVALQVDRDSITETVHIWARGWDADGITRHYAIVLDFNEHVQFIGLSVNPDDEDDTDYGVN